MQKLSVAHASLIKPQKRCDAALVHEFIQLFAKRRSSSVAPRRSYAKSLNSPNTGARRSLPHTPYVRNRPSRGGFALLYRRSHTTLKFSPRNNRANVQPIPV